VYDKEGIKLVEAEKLIELVWDLVLEREIERVAVLEVDFNLLDLLGVLLGNLVPELELVRVGEAVMLLVLDLEGLTVREELIDWLIERELEKLGSTEEDKEEVRDLLLDLVCVNEGGSVVEDEEESVKLLVEEYERRFFLVLRAEFEGVADADCVVVGVGVGVSFAVCDAVVDGVRVLVCVCEGVLVRVFEGVCVKLIEALPVFEADSDSEAVDDEEKETELVAVFVGETDGVSVLESGQVPTPYL
jgi:hypothetical protein